MNRLFHISMYFLSYFIVWISILFVDIKSILIDKNHEVVTEYISLVCIVLFTLASWLIITNFIKKTSKMQLNTYQISCAEEKKELSIEFILSTALPMVSFDFTIWSQMVLFLIFFISIGILSIHHNIFWVNIYFEIKGYRVFDTTLIDSRNNSDNTFRTLIISKKYLPNLKNKNIGLSQVNNQYFLHIPSSSDKFSN